MAGIEEPPQGDALPVRWAEAHDDALRFLDRLVAADPQLADAALTTEVDNLLGREPKKDMQKPERPRLPLDGDNQRESEFDWYQRILAQIPPLDDAYTFEAARRVEVGLLAEDRLETLDRSAATRRELSELYTLMEDGQAAWKWLVLTNLRLVFHWSKGVARSVDPDWAQDAFQVGCIGLMRGLQGWDYTLGYKLSTFVSWHVRQAIQRWRVNDVMIIRVPVHVWEALGSEERDPSGETREAAERAQDLASIDAMIGRGEDAEWDGGLASLEDRIDRDRVVQSLFDGLDERSLDIIERRFALRDDIAAPMTLDEIGDVWGLTRERIRQIEKKTLDALRAKAAGLPSIPAVKRKRRKKDAGELIN